MFKILDTELSTSEIHELYHECEFWEETGGLPVSSKLRAFIKENNHADNLLNIQIFSGFVYRALAQKYMEVIKLLK